MIVITDLKSLTNSKRNSSQRLKQDPKVNTKIHRHTISRLKILTGIAPFHLHL